MCEINQDKSLDLMGIGKLAKAIPAKVYTQTATTVLTQFEKLISPLTETSFGLGRYVRQKFDSLVEIEKSLLTYKLEIALDRAQAKAVAKGESFKKIVHPKSFVRVLEENARETDPLLSEMWINLLSSQIIDGECHPHFIYLLSNLSPIEANLLNKLKSLGEVGPVNKSILYVIESSAEWSFSGDDENSYPWDYSCIFLAKEGLAARVAANKKVNDKNRAIFYLTKAGAQFLEAVTA